jgi:hypothetical protein
MEQKRTQILAIVALCVGISSWVFGFVGYWLGGSVTGFILGILLGILAIVLGTITIVQIRKGLHKGRWMAIAGIVSGIMGMIGWGVALFPGFIDWIIWG